MSEKIGSVHSPPQDNVVSETIKNILNLSKIEVAVTDREQRKLG